MGQLRSGVRRVGSLALVGSALCLLLTSASARAQLLCAGDCNTDSMVAINELIVCVNIALGSAQVATCSSCDVNSDGSVTINELIQAVNNALNSCTPVGPTPTPGGGGCPLAPGAYTVTQVSGGQLTVATFSPFPFPAGGTLKQDVSDASPPDCIHNTVVPFPGGFSSPVFCVPSLGFTVEVKQTGCGVGQIDSNGGSDYTVTEIGDSSDTSDVCNIPQPGCVRGADSSVRVDVTVGDGTPDTCTMENGANAIVAVPVVTTTWIEHSSGDLCGTVDPLTGQPNGADGTFDPGPDPVHDDFLVTRFPQILDFTTDTNTTRWEDIDGDGCSIAGTGPAAGLTNTGVCLDLSAKTLTTVASGPIGSDGSPTFDLTYSTKLPNNFSGPDPATGATCDNPPELNFTGLAHQCIMAQTGQ